MQDVLNKIYDEITIIRKELDSLYKELLNLRKNNENEENSKIIITKYDNLTDKHNNLVDEYERLANQKTPANDLRLIAGAINFDIIKFAVGLIQPVGDDGVSPNIPIKRTKWEF